MKILFVHSDCCEAYSFETLEQSALGGTESTVLRISEGLARRGHEVVLAQGRRGKSDLSRAGVRYIPFRLNRPLNERFDKVVIIDTEKILNKLRRQYAGSKFFLWMHCIPGKRRARRMERGGLPEGVKVVAVSEYHKNQLMEAINLKKDRLQVHYNPISDDLQKNGASVDENKLLFLSSPHKGLKRVLDIFEKVNKVNPRFRLFIADPGYIKGFTPETMPEGVVTLGSMPHREVIEHLRTSFCLFYPQDEFEETFGLVFAEAHAVGTPVLAHPLGAAREVIGSERELVDAKNPDSVIEKILLWQVSGRPKPTLNPSFRLSKVLDGWELAEYKEELSKAQAS